VQERPSFAWRVEIVLRPALTWMTTSPLPHACARVAPAGRRSRPLVVKRKGRRRSRLGTVVALSERGVKRSTLTVRTAEAVWPAPSVATAVSVVRPTSSTVSG